MPGCISYVCERNVHVTLWYIQCQCHILQGMGYHPEIPLYSYQLRFDSCSIFYFMKHYSYWRKLNTRKFTRLRNRDTVWCLELILTVQHSSFACSISNALPCLWYKVKSQLNENIDSSFHPGLNIIEIHTKLKLSKSGWAFSNSFCPLSKTLWFCKIFDAFCCGIA